MDEWPGQVLIRHTPDERERVARVVALHEDWIREHDADTQIEVIEVDAGADWWRASGGEE